MKKLTETQKKVLDTLSQHPNSNADEISTQSGLTKLTVYATVKKLEALKLVNKKYSEGQTLYFLRPEENVTATIPKKNAVKKSSTGKRDFTKYKFNGELHSKGRLVLAIVTQYTKDHRNVTLAKLKEVFPDTLIPTTGVLLELSAAKRFSGKTPRFFLKPDEVIKLKDKTIAVTNQLTSSYLETFLVAAKKAGYKAQPA